MKKVVIVIPIYKNELSNYELISVERTFEVFKEKFDIVFVHPKKLDLLFYKNKFPFVFSYVSFEDNYFISLKGYNKLMLSIEFYNKFIEYNYLLICQADCYVFEDKLDYWCDKNYDYIGGIWFEGFTTDPYKGAKMSFPGNGGFSLRKVNSIINLLTSTKIIKNYHQLINETGIKNSLLKLKIKNILKFISVPFKYYNKKNKFKYLAKKYKHNEDCFFIDASNSLIDFKVPKIDDTIEFCWDRCPKYLFEINKKLPMACHAWFRNDFPYEGNLLFWESIIKKHTN